MGILSLEALLMRDLWMCGMTPPPAMVACVRQEDGAGVRVRCLDAELGCGTDA